MVPQPRKKKERKMLKITGKHGSWVVTVKGVNTSLPVVHSTFVDWKNLSYEEGKTNTWLGIDYASSKRWAKHAALIADKKMVIIQRDKIVNGAPHTARDGYIGLFFIANVKFSDGSLTFDIAGRQKAY
jgi:hypothetical protein